MDNVWLCFIQGLQKKALLVLELLFELPIVLPPISVGWRATLTPEQRSKQNCRGRDFPVSQIKILSNGLGSEDEKL